MVACYFFLLTLDPSLEGEGKWIHEVVVSGSMSIDFSVSWVELLRTGISRSKVFDYCYRLSLKLLASGRRADSNGLWEAMLASEWSIEI